MSRGTHEEIIRDIQGSDQYRWLGAMVLVAKGHTVIVPPSPTITHYQSRGQHNDGGDLLILVEDKDPQVVEVRKLNYAFSSNDDWPFRDYLLGPVASWNDPLWIISFSKSTEHYGLCSPRRSGFEKRVKIVNKCDGGVDREQENYVCSPTSIKFFKTSLVPEVI